MNKKLITSAAIDVGTYKVCTIVAQSMDSGALRVLGVGVSPSMGIRKGVVINIDEASEVIKSSVSKAERASGVKIRSATVGITGQHIESVNTSSAVAISRRSRIVQPPDVKRALQEARCFPLGTDRQLLHVIPRSYTLDGSAGVKSPIGMHGFRLDANAYVVSATSSAIKNLVKSVNSAGVEVEDLVLEPLASAEAALYPDEREGGVILLDIGGGTTDIAIFKEGSIYYSAILPVGGYQMTKDIAVGLGVSFEIAEQAKIKYGNVSKVTDSKAVKTVEAPSTVVDGHEILLNDLNDILQARVNEILMLALAQLPQQEYLSNLAPFGLVLTGGVANLKGLDQIAGEIFHLPVRIGVPKDIYGLADVLYNPAYAASVGLLAWGAKEYAGEWQVNRKRLVNRLKRFASHLISIRR